MLVDTEADLVLLDLLSPISSSIYANTFRLPSIVRRIQGTNDITVGLCPRLPWIAPWSPCTCPRGPRRPQPPPAPVALIIALLTGRPSH